MKLKSLFVVICCSIFSLFSETLSMDGKVEKWVVFEGGPGPNKTEVQILRQHGIQSVKKGVNEGSYLIEFTNPFPTKNYCAVLSAGMADIDQHTATVSGPYLIPRSSDSFQLYVQYAHGNSLPPVSGSVYVSAYFLY